MWKNHLVGSYSASTTTLQPKGYSSPCITSWLHHTEFGYRRVWLKKHGELDPATNHPNGFWMIHDDIPTASAGSLGEKTAGVPRTDPGRHDDLEEAPSGWAKANDQPLVMTWDPCY